MAHAERTNQVVVTYNHDMIMLCAERSVSVVWIDPRGRQFTRTELVPLVFTRVEEWQELLSEADNPACIRVLRTKTEVLELTRASDLVVQRMRSLQARKRTRPRRRPRGPKLEGT